jgi:hydrogenase maturation factor
MKLGKVPSDALAGLLAKLHTTDASVLLGPKVGEDAAVVQLGESCLVAAMDPITFATDLIGWYAVQVNANDVAVLGARPRWLLASLLVPPNVTTDVIERIFDQLAQACESLDIAPIGGHTEITGGIDRPIVTGCMLGEATWDRLVRTGGATPGDAIILCGPAAVEGTAVLAREAADELRAGGLDNDALARARGFLRDPGISVVAPALAAAGIGVKAMHDPTEGGVATGLRELALASEVGLEIEASAIPIDPVTVDVCRRLELDPLGVIASGALLIATEPGRGEELLAALEEVGPHAAVIGRATPRDDGVHLIEAGARRPLPEFSRDEVARFFEERSASC